MKKLILVLFSFILIIKVSHATTYSADPKMFVSELVNDAINKLSDKNLNKEDKKAKKNGKPEPVLNKEKEIYYDQAKKQNKPEEIIGYPEVLAHGGEVKALKFFASKSTSSLAKQIESL